MSSGTGRTGRAVAVRDVSKRYGRNLALGNIDLDVAAGEFVVLTGPSGAGKTTLLNLLAALEQPDTGTIEMNGRRLIGSQRRLDRFRRTEVGIVFQLHNLIPRLTAHQNVEVAMFGTHLSRRQRSERATELLHQLDLRDRATHRPPAMSGGERQRVAIARALANEPAVLLADEPTGSLDDESAAVVIELLERLRTDGRTIVAVSHDARLTAVADRVVRLVGPDG